MSFRQNILRGLGKCYVDILKSNNKEVFREDLLYAALNPISYDTFFEGTKSWYLYNLILNMDDTEYFENKIIEKLNIDESKISTLDVQSLYEYYGYDGIHDLKFEEE